MASNAAELLDADISKVTDIVSAENRLRFSIEYLGIDRNEYKTIEADAQFKHHDILFECITRWKNRTEAEGNHAKDQLIRILNETRIQHGWFPGNAMTFLTDVMGMQIPQDRLEKIRDWTKQSLKRRLHKSLSHDWIHEKISHKFPLREYYVQLEWKKKIRTALGSNTVTLTSIHDFIKQLTMEDSVEGAPGGTDSKRQMVNSVMIEGEGGIGKTSSLGIIALDWAEDSRPELKQFEFVFLILLRHVEGNEQLEHIIMQQHGLLKTMDVSPSEVKAIIKGHGNILLIFDGYDEYTEGCNEDIDEILFNGKVNCLTVLSSRSGDFLETIRSQMNEEVRITGFSYGNIILCAKQYLGSEQLCRAFLSQAEVANIHTTPDFTGRYNGLLHVPIILLMACSVFIENHCLPSSKTGLFKHVVNMCISRTTLKTMGKTASEVENLYELMVKLGKLAWKALTRKNKQLLIYKKDVIAESEEILKLGLLFGEDTNATTEELPAVLSFQHKLLQEYLAAVYIVKQAKLDTSSSPSFLTHTFPKWETIETHKEVVHFACGILADTNASLIANHVAKVQVKRVNYELNYGKYLHIDLSILQSCQKEGGLSPLNLYLSKYPAGGYPLPEMLANTELAYITDIDGNDPLDLSPSPVQTIVKLDEVDSERFDRLWHALCSVHANVIALHLVRVRSTNVTKLHDFPQLKYLDLMSCDCSKEAMEDLAESVNSWGPQPQLTYCYLSWVSIPRSLMTALCKCTHLKHLDLSRCNLDGKLSVFMADPPHALRDLILYQCSLHGADVDHLTQSIRQGHLTSLQELDIQWNPVGEVAVGHLLEALISIRPHTQLELKLKNTYVDENGKLTHLSEQFRADWKTKLTDRNINVTWSLW